jgi:putative flavoprotein involved in K+ transport
MWKPTRQDGLWLQGGNLLQARFYSKILALQIKARMEGIATPVYDPKVFGDDPRRPGAGQPFPHQELEA